MRINAYLARAGSASRRGADKLIKDGRVMVNGRPALLSDNVSDSDLILLDGNVINSQKMRYILLYKPAGYLTTLKDPHGRRKVTDLIDITERVVPVGRLDYDTTGALLLTNDGELAHKLMHPSFEINKVYRAKVSGTVTEKMLDMLSNGVEIEDEQIQGKMIQTAPAKAKKLADNEIEITLHEGRKHQVKRMMIAVGLRVTDLHRSLYGPLNLNGLNAGQWRELTNEEITQIKHL